MNNESNIGSRIAEALGGREPAWLAKELTKMTDKLVTRQTIHNWIKGLSNPSHKHLPMVCEILEVDPNFLYGWKVGRSLTEQPRKQRKAA